MKTASEKITPEQMQRIEELKAMTPAQLARISAADRILIKSYTKAIAQESAGKPLNSYVDKRTFRRL